jgi:hypothetical protein
MMRRQLPLLAVALFTSATAGCGRTATDDTCAPPTIQELRQASDQATLVARARYLGEASGTDGQTDGTVWKLEVQNSFKGTATTPTMYVWPALGSPLKPPQEMIVFLRPYQRPTMVEGKEVLGYEIVGQGWVLAERDDAVVRLCRADPSDEVDDAVLGGIS